MQFPGKLINQTWENGKETSFGPDFHPFGPNSGHLFFFFFFFFPKNLALPVTRYHGQLSSFTISEKTNDLILRKFSDGRTEGQTDWQEWFHRTVVCNGIPAPPPSLFKAPKPCLSLPPPLFLKSLFPLTPFLFHPILRYFRQFPPPSRNLLLS